MNDYRLLSKIINVLPCIPKMIIKYVSINHSSMLMQIDKKNLSKIYNHLTKIKDTHHTSNVGTPSPRKKRNNSTPTRKNNAEKKQILQQLISPNTNKVSEMLKLEIIRIQSSPRPTTGLKPPKKTKGDCNKKVEK